VGVALLSLVLAHHVLEFQTNPLFAHFEKGSAWELAWAVPAAGGIALLRRAVARCCHGWALAGINEERFPLEERRQERARVHAKWLVDIPYYGGMAVVGYVILLGMPNLPWYLGGSGHCLENYSAPLQFKAKTRLVVGFYVLQCGQHLYSFLAHLADQSPDGRAKFYETFLHHSLSMLLILMSYLTSQALVGIMVLVLHDSSDSLLILCRYYGDLKHKRKWLLYLLYLVTFSAWILLRLVAFPLCCIANSG
jgi:hypothetical protein